MILLDATNALLLIDSVGESGVSVGALISYNEMGTDHNLDDSKLKTVFSSRAPIAESTSKEANSFLKME